MSTKNNYLSVQSFERIRKKSLSDNFPNGQTLKDSGFLSLSSSNLSLSRSMTNLQDFNNLKHGKSPIGSNVSINMEKTIFLSTTDINEALRKEQRASNRKLPNFEKQKKLAKKNHITLKQMKMDNFEKSDFKPPTFFSPPNSDASSDVSTSSSGSSGEGIVTAWGYVWSLEGKNKSDSLLVPKNKRPTISQVGGACFLRNGYMLALTEPRANKLTIVTTKKGSLVSTVTGEKFISGCIEFVGDGRYQDKFRPVGVCETDNDDVLAVSDAGKIYLVNVTTNKSEIQAELKLKDRIRLQGVAFTNQSKLIVLDAGKTNKPFVGCYDEERLVETFKGPFSEPRHIAWSDVYRTAAIVDPSQRKIFFYDVDGKLLNTLSGSPTSKSGVSLLYPTGVCWTGHSQLLVADQSSDVVLSYDFRTMKCESALDSGDGIKGPVVLALNEKNKRLFVSEEEIGTGGKDVFRVKMFRRHGVSRTMNEEMF